MEHTTGPAKYLHKKFKKPSTSEITTVQSIEVDPSENVNTSSTDKHVDTTISHVTVCRNNNIISRVASTSPDSVSASNSNRDVNRNNFCSTNVESTSSVIYSESNLRILNRSPNDQVASISTSIASSVPEESRSLSTSYPVSSSASVFNVRNNDRCRREDTGPYIAPKSISLDRSILDTQNRNVHFMSNLLQADTNQSYNISALNTNESDNKTRIFFNGIDCESANEQLSFARQKIAEPRRSVASIDPEAERCAVNVSGTDRKNVSSEVKSSNSDSVEDERPPIENEPDARKTSLEPSSGGKYVCSYCNLSCSKPSVLQKHIRAHTNERPYPCVSCGFSFKTRSNLYKHCRSRSHANRAKDSSDLNVTKTATEASVPVAKMPERIAPSKSTEYRGMLSEAVENKPSERNKNDDDVLPLRTKPYKPKFHKLFLSEQNGDADDTENKEREEQKKKIETTKASFSNELVKQNPDLLKQHINNIIHKNQTILDVKEPNFLKKRFLHQIAFDDSTQKSVYRSACGNNFNINHDEPLNLTARNRKRCMSETEHTQKSLIKELLLKNLTQEQSYVCQFCKISFKNIENFEIHRKNYCKVGENPTSKDIAFVRSHSVNVASVLTQKYSRNNESPSKFVRTTLPLKSPGPCLGKTSLIDDKHWQVFYENRNPTKLHPVALSQENFKKMYEKNDVFPATSGQTKMNDILMNKSQNGIENDARKRNYEEYPNSYNSTYVSKAQATPFKMFGGEVKITETSGETRSFKIENMNTNEYSPDSPKIINYSMQISENMVIKSSLQSGGTVLQNTPTFEKKISPYTPKLDDNNSLSFQFFDSSKMPKNSFSKDTSPIRKKLYELDNIPEPATRFDFNIKPQEIMYDQNFIELNQKAAKIFAPNLKQPNLTIPGLPVPNKVFSSPKRHYSDNFDQQVSPSWSSLNSPLFSPAIAKHRHDIGPPTPDVFTSGPKIDQVKLSLPEPYIKSSSNLDIFPSSSANNQINLPQSFLGGIGINPQNLNISGLPLYDPLNIVVNGKLVRHVPGMPGPESGNSIHFGFVSTPVSPIIPIPKIIRTSPVPRESKLSCEKFGCEKLCFSHPNDSDVKNIDSLRVMTPNRNLHDMSRTSPTVSKQLGADSSKTLSITKATEQFNRPRSRSPLIHDESERFAETLVKISEPQKKSLKNFRIFTENSTKTLKNIEDSERVKSEIPLKSPLRIISEHQENADTQKTETSTMPLPSGSDGQEKQPLKFLRPNTLAIKPYMKTHHGLTPTMFNQALISPDTPRVAKKYCQLYLNGNCFSYLGLKSSTKVTYCTLNKTQPFYVVSFGKLSMYSEWRHLEAKSDFVRIDTYDSRQRKRNYSIAKIKIPDLLVDSSYKSVMVEASQKKEESNSRTNSLPGGYESNEEYTYIRGRGRGRYVCDQCGIRCKKPSMLKKHIRTHSDVRPYTCQQCNFSFKTKGNLTKHMKSKAHYKRTSTSNCSSSGNGNDMPASRSGSPTDEDSDTDNDVDNDSDDSTRLQEREAAHCLLSLAQNSSTLPRSDSNTDHTDVSLEANANHSSSDHEANSDQKINSKSEKSISAESSESSQKEPTMNHNVLENMSSKKPLTYPYCKVHSKITNDHREQKSDILKNDMSSNFNHVILGAKNIELTSQSFDGMKNMRSGSELLTSGNVTTPTKIQLISDKLPNADITIASFQQKFVKYEQERAMNPNKFSEFDLKVQKFMNLNENYQQAKITSPDLFRKRSLLLNENEKLKIESESKRRISPAGIINIDNRQENESGLRKSAAILDISENSPPRPNIARKRKLSLDYGENYDFVRKLSNISQPYENKALQKPNSSQPYEIHTRAMDLSVSREYVENRNASAREDSSTALDLSTFTSRRNFVHCDQNAMNIVSTVSEPISSVLIFHESQQDYRTCVEPSKTNLESHQDVRMNIKRKLLNYKMEKNELTEQSELNLQRPESVITLADNSSLDIDANSSDNSSGVSVNSSVPKSSVSDSDTSAMQTLAEIAMKRVPMENHSKQGQNIENTKLAQSVATEYLKLASKNETQPGVINESSVGSNGSGEAIISDLIVKSEENKSCTICAKNFAKPSQLRLHMNIHYLERPFRCESCSVSFRTKGHLQKHERSASHHNKLSSSPTTSSSEPRPFKCSDCNIAFRIHGHLAKHLRSKMHIMKLECLARVPFGLYAELERANSLLTEINTTDCDMCLDSLKVLARKLFSNDPSKLVQIENSSPLSSNSQEQLLVGSP